MPKTGISRNPLRRLTQKSWGELRFRGRQELQNRWDGLVYRLAGPGHFNGYSRTLPAPGRAARFFFSASELPSLAQILRARLPEAVEGTIEQAERICGHRFDLLGYSGLNFGSPIDWHLDPVHGKRAPEKLWYRIPYLEFETVGDAKIIWELNRHQHFVTLGKAFQLTGAEKYALEFARQFDDWRRANPYPIGVNWASALEVAFRSLSWLWARELFAGSTALAERARQDLMNALECNARFIERNLSIYFSANTHLLGEAVALYFIGTLCPELGRAPHWRSLGWEIVLDQGRRQVRGDGGYFEQSTYYHVYALDFLLHARILAARNHGTVPEELNQTLVAMLDYLAALGTAGPPPRFGDDDGGRVFDPRRNRAEHLLDPLSTGAVLFGRGDYKAAAGRLREETLWLIGPSAAIAYDHLSEDVAPAASRAFPETGTNVLASPGLRLAVDAGPMGTSRGGHAHADALSVCVAAGGRELCGDPGTFTYTGSREWRDWFRGTRAHNTLAVDGVDQAEPIEPFAWRALPETRIERWQPGETFDLLVASHEGYRRLASPVLHRRLVFFVKGRFWLVVDTVQGADEHELELNWNFPSQSVEVDGASRAVIVREGEGFAAIPVQDGGWRVELVDSWWSPSYGARQSSKTLRCSARVRLPEEFGTLLVPRIASPARTGTLERLRGDHADVRGYRYRMGAERHSWVMAGTTQVWQVGEVESDARIAYYEQGPDGRIVQAALCDGSYLAQSGEKVLAADLRCPRLEYHCSEGREELFCSTGAHARATENGAHPELAPVGGEKEMVDWT